MSNSILDTRHEFQSRHIGPREADIQLMLKELGFSDLEEMASKIIPKGLRTEKPYLVGDGISEFELLKKLKTMMGRNKVYTSLK